MIRPVYLGTLDDRFNLPDKLSRQHTRLLFLLLILPLVLLDLHSSVPRILHGSSMIVISLTSRGRPHAFIPHMAPIKAKMIHAKFDLHPSVPDSDLRLALLTSPKDFSCMVKTVYNESRGQPINGQIAVAYVVLHRIESARWPGSACNVIKQPNQFASYKKDFYTPMANRNARIVARQVAYGVVTNIYKDPTHGATCFVRAGTVKPWMTGLDQLRIGDQIFMHC